MNDDLRVIGRLHDLEQRGARRDEQRLGDVLVNWSPRHNRDWLRDGTRNEAPFLQVSPATPGTVLADELALLGREGYVAVGPLWLPLAWLHDGDGYRRFVRLLATHAPTGDDATYAAKVEGELEPLLAMWPDVILLPTARRLTTDELMRLRPWPVHPLGVTATPRHADGAARSPAEFWWHDVDHARFKVREDLLLEGHHVPDPYRDGDTWDAATGRHRAVMHDALPHVSASGWRRARARSAALDGWLQRAAGLADRELAAAVRWLLFELLHEKSLPVHASSLQSALAGGTHTDKLRRKCHNGFFADHGPCPAVVVRLDAARAWLCELFEERLPGEVLHGEVAIAR
ncbi:MAG: hypothetical protein H6835_03110 [Planctomycetes bacterium]|nr:hypothetical protein [Planctomycetota bacterium]